MLSVLTETPGITAPMQPTILPPTFQASCPPPQGSDTSAPGNVRQMAFTISRLIDSPWPLAVGSYPTVTFPQSLLTCWRVDTGASTIDPYSEKHERQSMDRRGRRTSWF